MRRERRAMTLVALCCTAAALLTGCGGPARDGYAAAGAVAPGPERRAGDNVAPAGPVELQQLGAAPSPATSTPPGTPVPQSTAGSARTGATTAPPGTVPPPGTPPGPAPPAPPPGSPATTKPGTTPPAAPATPANLTPGPPARTPAADRWCEKVTVAFTNTGTTAARSGTVTFSTHIIGALGIDWATITTTQPLPAPIPGGTTRTQTYTVCVESWRVPLGMHVETQKATATWT
ncbi:hypothetical protein ACFXA3_10925 [Streptomyces sp. NPDC059456]|uniref:hypothetical protein n=1 Tax=Streptomyces sp. NPDC059456 TaxID=3346838 RepID=UPI0036742085